MNLPQGWRKQKTVQLGALAALLIVCALVYRGRGGARGAVPDDNSAPAVSSSTTDTVLTGEGPVGMQGDELREAQRKRSEELRWGRDPFGGGLAAQSAEPAFILSGILWDPAQPLAMIGGQTVGVGDEVRGFRVEAIRQDGVTVSNGQQTLELTL